VNTGFQALEQIQSAHAAFAIDSWGTTSSLTKAVSGLPWSESELGTCVTLERKADHVSLHLCLPG
jgi:hypothetical protein